MVRAGGARRSEVTRLPEAFLWHLSSCLGLLPKTFLWHLSSCLGLLLVVQYRPVCSVMYCAPETGAQLAFLMWADEVFRETCHCRRVHLTWVFGRHVRRSARRLTTGTR